MARTLEAAVMLRLDDMDEEKTVAQRSIRFKVTDASEASIELALREALDQLPPLEDGRWANY